MKVLPEATILNFKNYFGESPTLPAPDNSINIADRLKNNSGLVD